MFSSEVGEKCIDFVYVVRTEGKKRVFYASLASQLTTNPATILLGFKGKNDSKKLNFNFRLSRFWLSEKPHNSLHRFRPAHGHLQDS
jgi:hypothetical protein